MKDTMRMVAAFHVAVGQSVLTDPAWPAENVVKRRNDLLEEEFLEYIAAIACRDMVGVADALADMVYIIAGTALELGIPLARVFDEVHRSNMLKVDPETGTVRRRADGKILKPVNWMPPDIRSILYPQKAN